MLKQQPVSIVGNSDAACCEASPLSLLSEGEVVWNLAQYNFTDLFSAQSPPFELNGMKGFSLYLNPAMPWNPTSRVYLGGPAKASLEFELALGENSIRTHSPVTFMQDGAFAWNVGAFDDTGKQPTVARVKALTRPVLVEVDAQLVESR